MCLKMELARTTRFFSAKTIDIIRGYLKSEDSLPLAEAARSIANLLPESKEPRGSSVELSTLWQLCCEIAERSRTITLFKRSWLGSFSPSTLAKNILPWILGTYQTCLLYVPL